MMNNQDPHHCHCFSIHSNYFQDFKEKLESIEFKDTILQEPHDHHVYGLVKRIDEYTQIHVKVMKNGNIEAEMEYPPAYPFAHLNQEHSYSAHPEIEMILKHFQMTYTYRLSPPITCLIRKIKTAFKPTHAKVIFGVALGFVAIISILYALSKMDDKK